MQRQTIFTSRSDFSQAIKIDSRNIAAWNNRCGARYRQGLLNEAIADCNQAIKLDARYAFFVKVSFIQRLA